MEYRTAKYAYGGIAVMAFENGEPFANCSVCLYDYGYIPPKGHIVVPTYKLLKETNDKIISDIADEVVGTITFGPYKAEGTLIRLKEEYR